MITFVIILHSVLAFRFFQLQILDFEFYNKRADSNRIRAISLPASRGLILDRHGEIIVDNYPTYILYGIGAEIRDKQKNYKVISHSIGIDTSILKKNYKNYYRNRFLPTRLVKDLTIEQLSRLEEAKNDLSGIMYKQFPERIYNPKIRASHVLGYLKEMDQEMIQKMVSNGDY
jgi:penicillin-binding protein 2